MYLKADTEGLTVRCLDREDLDQVQQQLEADGYDTTVRGLIITITSLPGGYEEKSERRTS